MWDRTREQQRDAFFNIRCSFVFQDELSVAQGTFDKKSAEFQKKQERYHNEYSISKFPHVFNSYSSSPNGLLTHGP